MRMTPSRKRGEHARNVPSIVQEAQRQAAADKAEQVALEVAAETPEQQEARRARVAKALGVPVP